MHFYNDYCVLGPLWAACGVPGWVGQVVLRNEMVSSKQKPSAIATSHSQCAERRRGGNGQVSFPDSPRVDYLGACRARQKSNIQVVSRAQ